MQSNEQCLNCECFLIVDQYGVSIYIAEKFLEYAKKKWRVFLLWQSGLPNRSSTIILSLPAIQDHVGVLLLNTADYKYDWCRASEYTLEGQFCPWSLQESRQTQEEEILSGSTGERMRQIDLLHSNFAQKYVFIYKTLSL